MRPPGTYFSSPAAALGACHFGVHPPQYRHLGADGVDGRDEGGADGHQIAASCRQTHIPPRHMAIVPGLFAPDLCCWTSSFFPPGLLMTMMKSPTQPPYKPQLRVLAQYRPRHQLQVH